MDSTRLRALLDRALAKSRPLLAVTLAKAGGSATQLLQDDDLMVEVATRLHGLLPGPTRWFLRREAFVRFALGRRDAFIPFLAAADAKPVANSVGATVPDEYGAAPYFERDGKRPDSVLRCTIQTGDAGADFLHGLVGTYREDRFLRILMQNDEPDDPRGYWRSWDMPWSEFLEIILRTRTTPTVLTDIRQPDGTYGYKGPYYQTRLYRAGEGRVYRFLGRDDPRSSAPFEWLKANIDEPEIRFAEDTQENPIYGDNLTSPGDSLTEYAMAIKMRSERADDAEFSRRALTLTDGELAQLRAAAPKEFSRRHFNLLEDIELKAAPKDFASLIEEFDRWYRVLVGERAETVSPALRDYAKSIVERLLLGVIKSRYYGIFFYDHFPTEPDADGATKAKLLQVVRWMRPGGTGGLV